MMQARPFTKVVKLSQIFAAALGISDVHFCLFVVSFGSGDVVLFCFVLRPSAVITVRQVECSVNCLVAEVWDVNLSWCGNAKGNMRTGFSDID